MARKIDPEAGWAAVEAFAKLDSNGLAADLGTGQASPDAAGDTSDVAESAPETTSDSRQLALAVRYTTGLLAQEHPGNSVEVRVAPWAAVQCLPGPVHTRGTPSNVVQLDAHTWLRLVIGTLSWAQALQDGKIEASGVRSDLSDLFNPGTAAPWLARLAPRPLPS